VTKPAPIVHFLYEPGDGGLDRVAIYLANGMAEKGIATELWLTKAAGPLANMIDAQVKIRMVPTPAIGGRGVQLFLQIPALAKMIRKHRPRAIFSAGNQSNLSIALARKLAGAGRTKIIQKITNPIKRPGMGGLKIAMRRSRFGLTARLGDMCLALSKPDADNYARMFPVAADKFKAVRNAYVTSEMSAIGQRRKARSSSMPRLLAVGRIAVQKDYANMIRALAKVKDQSWTLKILGDGPLLGDIKELATQLGISDRIDFKGFVPDAAPYYADADILILSSKWEGFAAAPIEAMACGCHVVATDSSAGLTHLLAKGGHQTVPVNDCAALAKAITAAIDTQQNSDPRQIAANYLIDKSVDDHLRLLEIAEHKK